MEINRCLQTDLSFPKRLKGIKRIPEELYYVGNIDIINSSPCVAIIGSRKVSENGLNKSYEYGRIAAKNGFVVVNGLALGCDAQVIRGALAEGARCVAVLPGGLDHIYPKSNEGLAQDILNSGGCLVSEYREGVRPTQYTFVQRDRIQSGISGGVIVVETESSGGTMHTVKYAKQQNRKLACYYSKLMSMASGNEEIVAKGMGIPIDDELSIEQFLADVRETKFEYYEQLSFF